MKNGTAQSFLRPKEIVAEIGVSYRAFLREIHSGRGPKFKRIGKRILIRKDWYDAWIESNAQT